MDLAIANVLDAFAAVDPSKMVHKLKLHLLTHGRYDILRFGPLVGQSTEGFESFNGVFRYCSVYSNHHAPSRDIALQLANQESMKHRLTGGYWSAQRKNGTEWERAGEGVREAISMHPIIQRLVGWVPDDQKVPGKLLSRICYRGNQAYLNYFRNS